MNNGLGLGYAGKACDLITGLSNCGYRDYPSKVTNKDEPNAVQE
jgi:hypothetical protein